jgi:hypothetical protein
MGTIVGSVVDPERFIPDPDPTSEKIRVTIPYRYRYFAKFFK